MYTISKILLENKNKEYFLFEGLIPIFVGNNTYKTQENRK